MGGMVGGMMGGGGSPLSMLGGGSSSMGMGGNPLQALMPMIQQNPMIAKALQDDPMGQYIMAMMAGPARGGEKGAAETAAGGMNQVIDPSKLFG